MLIISGCNGLLFYSFIPQILSVRITNRHVHEKLFCSLHVRIYDIYSWLSLCFWLSSVLATVFLLSELQSGSLGGCIWLLNIVWHMECFKVFCFCFLILLAKAGSLGHLHVLLLSTRFSLHFWFNVYFNSMHV